MTNCKEKYEGSVALVSMIVFMTLIVLGGMSLLYSAIDLSKTTVDSRYMYVAKINAWTCIEESVQKLKYDTAYTGLIQYENEPGDGCTANVIDDTAPNVKIVISAGEFGDFERVTSVKIDISEYPFQIIKDEL